MMSILSDIQANREALLQIAERVRKKARANRGNQQQFLYWDNVLDHLNVAAEAEARALRWAKEHGLEG